MFGDVINVGEEEKGAKDGALSRQFGVFFKMLLSVWNQDQYIPYEKLIQIDISFMCLSLIVIELLRFKGRIFGSVL